MSEIKSKTEKNYSPEWIVRGVLTKLGDTFDRLTGRNWKPSSSLATSELIERLKKILDSEVQDLGKDTKYVPHNLKIKMQWDKFSSDSEKALKMLETEILTATVDHINDNLYRTFAPLILEIKPDYFTSGVQILTSFDKFLEEDREAAVNVTLPNINLDEIELPQQNPVEQILIKYWAIFTINDVEKKLELNFKTKSRLSAGRGAENDVTISDTSISKIHASLVLDENKNIVIADTGSTNGTFVNEQRIAYGKAITVGKNDKVRFGTVTVSFETEPIKTEVMQNIQLPESNSVFIDEFEFKSRQDTPIKVSDNEKETSGQNETHQGVKFDFSNKE